MYRSLIRLPHRTSINIVAVAAGQPVRKLLNPRRITLYKHPKEGAMKVYIKNYEDIIKLMVDLGILEENNITEEKLSVFVNELFKHILIRDNKP
jgi:hypothetical protein